jgi:hypothetical protein
VEWADVLCKPLWIIYKLSLQTGKVPVEWKKANVMAIFKKGSKEVAGNYRPVSLTTHVWKVLETLVKDVLTSCLTNLLGFFEDVTALVDKGECIQIFKRLLIRCHTED